jgi:predicted kinase
VAAFDCIEFDPALRWIDVIDDIAFPVMDFSARGRSNFAFRLLNAWLDRTGDHNGLPMLRFSAVYRALVRSQVAHLRGDNGVSGRRYLETAIAWTKAPQRRLVITHGLPGSGKSFESQRLLEREGAIRIRSDVERKRLFGLDMLEDSRAKGLDLYTADATARTYDRLLELARVALQAGYPVVLDAAFLNRSERDAARELAHELQVPFSILACEAPVEVLRARLLARLDDASEADATVLEQLRTSAEPLGADERESDAGQQPARTLLR